MTRLRAVPEPFIAIVFGLLIGVAVNMFSINPGALRNMQVRPFAALSCLLLACLRALSAQHHFSLFFAYDPVRARVQPRQVALFQEYKVLAHFM